MSDNQKLSPQIYIFISNSQNFTNFAIINLETSAPNEIMSDWTSDFIITICVIIGAIIIKLLPKKIKWGWRLLIGLLTIILLSTLSHLIVKLTL